MAQDIFSTVYCANCFEPIEGEIRGNCSACGEPLVPIDLFSRVKRDKDIAKVSFRAFWAGIILLSLSLTVHLIYSAVSVVISIKEHSGLPFSSDGILCPLWEYGAVASAASAVLTLTVIVIIAAELYKRKPRGLSVVYGAASGLACVIFFSMNFVSMALLLCGIAVLGIMETKVRNRALKKRRLTRLDKSRFEKLHSKEWRCESCGYINSKKDGECKSCGKYK